MFGCQQILLHVDPDTQAVIEYLCSESNKLMNCTVYYARQIFFKVHRYVSKAELDEKLKTNRHFQAMYSQASQQTCHTVFEAFKSFKALNTMYKRGELAEKPKPPKYRKGGLNVVSYPKQALRLVDGCIRIPLGRQVLAWFGIDSITLKLPSNLNFEDIKELKILPRNRCFYLEYVYKAEVVNSQVDPGKVLGIDPGLNNWLTCVSNTGLSFIIDGRHVKSLNRWYNKQLSTIKEDKPQGFWSNKLAFITEKRNRQMRNACNKAARLVINNCLRHGIGTVVFGWNQGNKQEINLGRKNNQKIVQIPTAKLKERISQLCKQHGIRFVETEEANTSAASFLDGDSLPRHGEKPSQWKSSGKRVKRGLFRTAQNWYVNADAQAAANIINKVAVTLGLDLSEIGRASLATPHRLKLWSAKQLLRGTVLTCRVATV